MNLLRAWLDQAWDEHAEHPRRVLEGLRERAPSLPDDGDGAEAVRLAEHVALAHLADTTALDTLLAALPAQGALQPAVARARWALATLAGSAPPEVPDRARWAALHGVVMTLVARGRGAEARRRLLADEAAAATHADMPSRQAYAATANNSALDLRLGARGDPARDALMVDAALLARRAWSACGGWIHVERADYQLAMCHAAAGQGAQAVAAGEACLAACEANAADAAERFFAHECLVHARRAAGDAGGAAREREQMAALLAQVDDAAMRSWCEKTLAET